ncbi:hypothetical protein V202x_07050 [Gimesia aquarii]|uniref:Uncharacterized protein n=2 Tax=Gimesia aquarii TaxID=2527964 RepID=A0A517WQ28_9PLAN|nr:hypothetical protein V202x_07050 [Gimesia aquarii]
MFDEESFLSMDLMKEEFSKFDWPEPYRLENELPDGIIVSFPQSNFVFSESPDGDINVKFLPEDTKCENMLQLAHALSVLLPKSDLGDGPITPGFIEYEWPFPSEKKARIGIHNACTFMLTHLSAVIGGDFSWVQKYVETRDNKAY